MKEYNYIEKSMQTNLDTTSPQEQKPLLIEAISDSAAYIQAYLEFCIAKKFYYKEFKKSGEPISFRLLNEDSIDISKSIEFLNKKEIEKDIEKRVTLFEPAKDTEK